MIGRIRHYYLLMACWAVIFTGCGPTPEARFGQFVEHVNSKLESVIGENGKVSKPIEYQVDKTDRTKAPYAAQLTLALSFPGGNADIETDYEASYALRDDVWICEKILAVDEGSAMDITDVPKGEFVPLLKNCEDF